MKPSIKPIAKTPYITAHHLDASAALKLVIAEPGSNNLRPYFSANNHFFITSLCLAEALGVLKRKLLKKELSKDDYFSKCFMLLAYARGKIQLDEIDVANFAIFNQAEQFAKRYDLDLSDALQLVSVKHGKFSAFVEESKTVLITADSNLEKAAKKEGLRVWNCQQESLPPPK